MGNERVSGPPPKRKTRVLLVEGDALVLSSLAPMDRPADRLGRLRRGVEADSRDRDACQVRHVRKRNVSTLVRNKIVSASVKLTRLIEKEQDLKAQISILQQELLHTKQAIIDHRGGIL
jgi:hypothetical protein